MKIDEGTRGTVAFLVSVRIEEVDRAGFNVGEEYVVTWDNVGYCRALSLKEDGKYYCIPKLDGLYTSFHVISKIVDF